ncbi:uncharacterized protein LOC142979281 [Anticarsia gemmatalis]|uniref:uncharacterized protein LOC142979281 n=1 Tax=Anticarsia gemmatalis TaxID=129554 RepID=UPI003F7656CF
MSKQMADQLFPSSDESTVDVPTKSSKKKRKVPEKTSDSQPSTTKKTKAKATARDLFGTDSDDDDELHRSNTTGKKIAPIYSYVTRRLANGFSRQIDEDKTGNYYIELKIYNTDEIERVPPVNRWRHSVITIKNKTNSNTESWKHINEFIKETRKEFKNRTPTFISSYQ